MSKRINGVRDRFADLNDRQIYRILRAWELIKIGGSAQYWLDRIKDLPAAGRGADWARDEGFLTEVIEANGVEPE